MVHFPLGVVGALETPGFVGGGVPLGVVVGVASPGVATVVEAFADGEDVSINAQ